MTRHGILRWQELRSCSRMNPHRSMRATAMKRNRIGRLHSHRQIVRGDGCRTRWQRSMHRSRASAATLRLFRMRFLRDRSPIHRAGDRAPEEEARHSGGRCQPQPAILRQPDARGAAAAAPRGSCRVSTQLLPTRWSASAPRRGGQPSASADDRRSLAYREEPFPGPCPRSAVILEDEPVLTSAPRRRDRARSRRAAAQ